jgi:hypothetical protein
MIRIDIVERLIGRYSNPGDVVLDPFAGIFTVPYLAVQLGRIGWGVELNHEYWRCGTGYCQMAEAEAGAPTLFDMEGLGIPILSTESSEKEGQVHGR